MPFDVSPPLDGVRSLDLASTAQAIKASKGNVLGMAVINRHSAAAYLKLYNKAAAGVNPAIDVPKYTFQIPANSQLILRGTDAPWSFATAISMRCVTEATDSGTTAAGTLPIVEIDFK